MTERLHDGARDDVSDEAVPLPLPPSADDEASALRAELAAERLRAHNLEIAVQSNRKIGIAIGIVMAQQRVDAERAFELLVAASQISDTKVRDIAEHVAYTGTLETLPGLTRRNARRPAHDWTAQSGPATA